MRQRNPTELIILRIVELVRIKLTVVQQYKLRRDLLHVLVRNRVRLAVPAELLRSW